MTTGKNVLFVIIIGVLFVGCNVDSAYKKADSFNLPSKIISKAKIMEKGNGVEIIGVTSEDLLSLKLSLNEFSTWSPLKQGTMIKSDDFSISGNSSHSLEYSVGRISNGLVRVLVYDQTNDILYAIFADGVM